MAHGEPRSNAPAQADAERLLIEAAQKDPARFAELYESNVDRVYAFIARRVRDRNEAEDVTSEVFHQALAGLSRFEWRGVPIAAWLYKIASNAIIDRAKRDAREQQYPELLEAAGDRNPQGREEEIEHHAQLFQLVDRLPLNQQRVLDMRFAEGRTIREIAQELGRSEGAIKQLQFRALQNLRSQLTDESGDQNV
jgi:RNA polymerase sigma-70 factor, ECF subfamily